MKFSQIFFKFLKNYKLKVRVGTNNPIFSYQLGWLFQLEGVFILLENLRASINRRLVVRLLWIFVPTRTVSFRRAHEKTLSQLVYHQFIFIEKYSQNFIKTVQIVLGKILQIQNNLWYKIYKNLYNFFEFSRIILQNYTGFLLCFDKQGDKIVDKTA